MKKFSRKKYEDIAPDEIFLDSSNLPNFDSPPKWSYKSCIYFSSIIFYFFLLTLALSENVGADCVAGFDSLTVVVSDTTFLPPPCFGTVGKN